MVHPARTDLLILVALAVYFAAQAVLRIALGGALEVDEAEMLVLARTWAWGYGPQFPLYNWLQAGAFALFGPTTVALAVLKNAVLWLAAALLYLGLRRVLAVPQALAGMLSLALLPNVIWEFQRASTHSIVLLAAVSACIWAFFRLVVDGRRRDAVIFGLVLGLGGLSKVNFWLVPAVLGLAAVWTPGLPARPSLRRLALAGAVALAVVALPYLWIVTHPELAGASQGKMYRADTGLPAGIEGLGEALVGILAGLLPLAIAVALLWRSGRGRPGAGPVWPGELLLRAGLIGLAASLVVVLLAGMSEVQGRWMVPAFVLTGAGAMALAARRASVRGLRLLSGAAAALGLVTLAGMAELRLNGPSTGGISFAPLAELTDRTGPDLIFADYHLGGNLLLLRPQLVVVAPLPTTLATGPVRVLILTRRSAPPDPEATFRARALKATGLAAQPSEQLDLPYANAPGRSFPVTALSVSANSITPTPD